jgi:CubicO group peptidase (beta-lactamase class C family)
MPGQPLLRSTPEAQGISSTALLGFVDALDKDIHEMHSLMLLRHGRVVAEGWWKPYRPESLHMLFSLSKSFTSTGVGLAVAEGLLSVDDPVISFFPKDTPKVVSENLAAMRVRHLLSMSSGHDQDTTRRVMKRKNWVKGFLALPVEHAPGTHWVYNTAATYMLSAIVQKVTGLTLLDYLQPRLLDPLGIEGATWGISPQGINLGGFGLDIKTEDIARFGQLYLQKGLWNGKRILPEAWVEEATASHIANDRPDDDWHQGYGYQFWRCRHNAYRGDGAFGQYCVVMPEQDAVLAITSAVDDMQVVLNKVWQHLLPAFCPAPLPADAAAQAALTEKLYGLALPLPQGQSGSPAADQVCGKTYILSPNRMKLEAVSFDFSGDGCRFRMRSANGEQTVICGFGSWVEGIGIFNERLPAVVAASGAWTAEDIYTMTLRFFETPFFYTYTCRFKGNQVKIGSRINVSFGRKEAPLLVGFSG